VISSPIAPLGSLSYAGYPVWSASTIYQASLFIDLNEMPPKNRKAIATQELVECEFCHIMVATENNAIGKHARSCREKKRLEAAAAQAFQQQSRGSSHCQ
jgi:hypothetical protein